MTRGDIDDTGQLIKALAASSTSTPDRIPPSPDVVLLYICNNSHNQNREQGFFAVGLVYPVWRGAIELYTVSPAGALVRGNRDSRLLRGVPRGVMPGMDGIMAPVNGVVINRPRIGFRQMRVSGILYSAIRRVVLGGSRGMIIL
jgi:hypothetical protein